MSDFNQSELPVETDGFYAQGENDRPSSTGIIAHERNASPSGTTQTKRVTAIEGEDNSVAMDVALKDHNGNAFDALNPLPTYSVDAPGDELHDYDEASDVASDATSNHDYTPSGSKLLLKRVEVSSSDTAKHTLFVKSATGSFEAKGVRFTRVANENSEFVFNPPITIEDGGSVRVAKLNGDNQVQSLYSTIMGDLI